MPKDAQHETPTLIEVGDPARFTPTTRYRCPQCGGPALQDHWPPNASGGTLSPTRIAVHGSIKHVCVPCRITFRIKWEHLFEGGQQQEHFSVVDITPLVERDGQLLTPYDVWRFAHFHKYDVWPTETWRK